MSMCKNIPYTAINVAPAYKRKTNGLYPDAQKPTAIRSSHFHRVSERLIRTICIHAQEAKNIAPSKAGEQSRDRRREGVLLRGSPGRGSTGNDHRSKAAVNK